MPESRTIANPTARQSVVVGLHETIPGVIDPPVDMAIFDIILPEHA